MTPNSHQQTAAPETETRTEELNESQPRAAGRSTEHTSAADRATIRYQTMPTVRPVLIVLGLVLGASFVTTGLLWVAPEFVGGEEIATIIMSAVAILVTISTLRLLIKIVVLSRTQYTIRDDAFHREYDLLYRTQSREIPVQKLRGHEYSQGRLQALLGFGTIRLLTAGTNRSLGFLEFEHLNDPERVRAEIRRLSTETRE